MDVIKNIFDQISFFDLLYVTITILYLIRCSIKGFVLSLLSAAKWLLAYILTLIIFPKVKPYVKDIIDNEYVLDILLAVLIFVIIMFIILLINKGIKRTVKYTGMGKIDVFFGFLFGFVKAYVVSVCIFASVHIVYNYDKWPIDNRKSFTFSYVEKGSNYLIKEFPSKKEYEDAKEKVSDI
tara:strand:+ start:438 stop:980 length:543 start_codon:yes stop_codon:yes gene_type:complete